MKAEHEPDPTFVDHLEWQMRTTLRREGRFAQPVTRRGRSLVRTAALVALSLTLGAAGAVAAGKLQDERQRELLLTHVGVRMQVAQVRLAAADEALDRAEARFRDGVVSETEAWDVRRRVLADRFELERLELERREIALTGHAPQDGPASPAVAGRDLVADRLRLELRLQESLLAIVQDEHALARAQVDHGLLNSDQLAPLELQLQDLRLLIDDIARRLQLRRRFLAGELSAEAVEYESWRLDARRNLSSLRARQEHLLGQLELARRRFEVGLESGAAAEQIQVQLVEVEAALRLHELEAEMMEAQLAPPREEPPLEQR